MVRDFERASLTPSPVWIDGIHKIGKAIGRGEHTYLLPKPNEPGTDEEDQAQADADYASYLRRMQEPTRLSRFIPEDAEAFQNGIRMNIALAEESQDTSGRLCQGRSAANSPRHAGDASQGYPSLYRVHRAEPQVSEPRYSTLVPNRLPLGPTS